MSVAPSSDAKFSLATSTTLVPAALNGPHIRHLESSTLPQLTWKRQIVPVSTFSKKTSSRANARLVRDARATKTSFRQAYGALGLPLLLVAVACILWTSWLIFLTLAPNEAANRLMQTGDYDNGQFWLIVEREPFIKWSSALGFAVVDVSYMAVLVKMFMFRSIAKQVNNGITPTSWYVNMVRRCRPQQVVKLWVDLTGYNSTYRKYFNVFLKAGDLVFQGLVLYRTLAQGFPDTLVIGYACFVSLNGLTCVLNIVSAKNSAFAEVLIDSIFDLSAAVLFPMLVLAYCTYYFQFDRAVFLVNVDVLDEGTFERFARMQADPAQVALFLINFNSLRIKSAMDFVLNIGMNLSFCHRFSRIIEILATQSYRMGGTKLGPTIAAVNEAERSYQKPVPRWFALPFLLASIFAVVYTYQAMEISHTACHHYPQCVAFSHVWDSGVNCSCLMLIDTDRIPRTTKDWYSPVDATEAVRTLAVAGTLQGLQIINRQLQFLPEELRRCTGLESIVDYGSSLIYTSTEELPEWITELKQLQFLHIEGKYGSRNFETLPSDLFRDLPRLSFLHLGNHYHLTGIPPFNGTPSLRSVTLAILLSVTQLPPLKHLSRLEALALVQVPQVPALLDLDSLTSLSRLTLYRPNRICCNGFMGDCNLSDSYCMDDPVFGVPKATCLDENDPRRASPATLQILKRFPYTICQRTPLPLAIEALSDKPSPDRIEMCAGVLYRQCHIPGVTSDKLLGMCYSARMQVIACNVDQAFIQVRRVQIQRHVGLPCDPKEEAWLGCQVENEVQRRI
ncbi:hypothetical protein V7S43_017592 [Phytophthora oleae]|uniref:WLGC domain-containing protein n=1 Tax=Phytophthora oleae TaxID=2107226 RepID=A0ABD3ETF9_9STRA